MIIVVLALVGALIITAILVGARYLLRRSPSTTLSALAPWALGMLLISFVVNLLILYFAMPAFAGPYGGWQWLLWPLLLCGIICLGLSTVAAGQRMAAQVARGQFSRGRIVPAEPPDWRMVMAEGAGAAGVLAIALALVVALIFNSLISIATTWFDPNAKSLAAIPHVTTTSEQLPPTDVSHIVLVTQGIAAFKGQQVLAQNGQNLGSTYHLNLDSYTLQSVNKHLYWIAPLLYNNVFANLGNYDTPGFVAVDAENPDTPPSLHTGYHIHYVPGAVLNQDLMRHVYLSGYTNGNLVDPTLEVRDDWQPFYTISLMQPSRGFTGEILKQVLLVDPQSGKIQAYAPADVPDWVDRIYPASTVSEYMGWWGLYHGAPWFDPAGTGQQQLASDPELVYNSVDQPVWLVPMTSNSSHDSSSTGIVLFDTKKNDAQFYPLSGLGVGANVKTAFASNPTNIRNYDVSSVQLYEIYGEPTWVAIFTQSTGDTGSATFQAVGMVDARDLSGASVQMAPSRDLALAAYGEWLATHNHIEGSNPAANGSGKVQGKVVRIAPVTSNGNTVFYIQIEGQKHIFTAALSLSPELPLVQPGDMVTVEYLETGQQVVTLTSFKDDSLAGLNPGG